MAADAFLELLKKSSDLPDEAFRSISTYVKDKRYGTAQLLRVYGKLFEDEDEVFQGNATVEAIVRRMVNAWQERLRKNVELDETRGEQADIGCTPSEIFSIGRSESCMSQMICKLNDSVEALLSKVDSLTLDLSAEREAARDREVRYVRRISFLERELKEQKEQNESILNSLCHFSSVLSQNVGVGSMFSGKKGSSPSDKNNRIIVDHEQRTQTVPTVLKQPCTVQTGRNTNATRTHARSTSSSSKQQTVSVLRVQQVQNAADGTQDFHTTTDTAHDQTTASKEAPRDILVDSSPPSRSGRRLGRARALPGWDSGDEDETSSNLWKLVTAKKPAKKKCVLYIGRVSKSCTEQQLEHFILQRAEHVGEKAPKVYATKIFSKSDDNDFNAARIVVDYASSQLILTRNFWPRPLYSRRWNFDRATPSSETEGLPDQEKIENTSSSLSPGALLLLSGRTNDSNQIELDSGSNPESSLEGHQ